MKPTCDKAPPSLAGAHGRTVISQQTGNAHQGHRLTCSSTLDRLAMHIKHAALSRGKDRGTSPSTPSPASEGAACTQSFMELGSVPCWAAPGQHLTPLACFLICKTIAMVWTELFSRRRASTFTV